MPNGDRSILPCTRGDRYQKEDVVGPRSAPRKSAFRLNQGDGPGKTRALSDHLMLAVSFAWRRRENRQTRCCLHDPILSLCRWGVILLLLLPPSTLLRFKSALIVACNAASFPSPPSVSSPHVAPPRNLEPLAARCRRTTGHTKSVRRRFAEKREVVSSLMHSSASPHPNCFCVLLCGQAKMPERALEVGQTRCFIYFAAGSALADKDVRRPPAITRVRRGLMAQSHFHSAMFVCRLEDGGGVDERAQSNTNMHRVRVRAAASLSSTASDVP